MAADLFTYELIIDGGIQVIDGVSRTGKDISVTSKTEIGTGGSQSPFSIGSMNNRHMLKIYLL